MTIEAGLRRLFLINGNNGTILNRLTGSEELEHGDHVYVLYTDNAQRAALDRKISNVARSALIDLERVDTSKSKKGAVKKKMLHYATTLSVQHDKLQIILLSEGGVFDQELKRLRTMGRKVWTFPTITQAVHAGLPSDRATLVQNERPVFPAGGHIEILIDYENVNHGGLEGAEYLGKDDSVTLFYSASAASIQRQHFDAFCKAGAFSIVKLVDEGKNNLDFYIAVKVGELLSKNPESKILIVSKDQGFYAVQQYCASYSALKNQIVIESTIERGIALVDGETTRKAEIERRRESVAIESEFKVHEARRQLQEEIAELLSGEGYGDLAERVYTLLDKAETPREKYLSMLKGFGRSDGGKIYRLIRKVG